MNRLAPDSLLWSGWPSTMSKKKPFPAPQQAPALQARTASLLWELALRARFVSAPRVYSGSLRCKPALRARTATRPASLRCEPALWCYQPALRVRPITPECKPAPRACSWSRRCEPGLCFSSLFSLQALWSSSAAALEGFGALLFRCCILYDIM